jgi:hypothetical protein
VVVVHEFCKEEVVISDAKRMADEANRMGQQAQEGFQTGLEAVSRSFSDANKGVQSMAAELTDFSKSRWEDVFHAWEQLLRARHLGDVVEVQARYAQRACDAYMSEWTKLGEICVGMVRDASKPVEDASRRSR